MPVSLSDAMETELESTGRAPEREGTAPPSGRDGTSWEYQLHHQEETGLAGNNRSSGGPNS